VVEVGVLLFGVSVLVSVFVSLLVLVLLVLEDELLLESEELDELLAPPPLLEP